MAYYDQEYGPYRESRTGKKVIMFAGLVVGSLFMWTKVLPEGAKDRLTTHHDNCGELAPFYKAPEGMVVSCAPLVDKTTQQVERGLFTYIPQPGSLRAMGNGNYAVGVELLAEGDAAEHVFGRTNLSLSQLNIALQENETSRAYCVSDMERVVDHIQQNTPLYAKGTVSEFDIGDADNAYSVGPAGLDDNDPERPDLFIYDSTSNLPTKDALITCWSP